MFRRSRVLLMLLAVTVAGPAVAVPIEFVDPLAWNAAVAGDIFLETFDEITGDPSFSSAPNGAPIDVGPFTIEQIGDLSQSLGTSNKIDEAVFSFSGADDVDGSTHVLGFVSTSSTTDDLVMSIAIRMLFDTPVAAWGADFQAAGNQSGIDFWLIPAGAALDDPAVWVDFDGNNALANATVGGFLGFVDFTGALYDGVVIRVGSSSTGQRFGMDNVTGATIPEPSTAGLLALGLAGLAVVGRRRR